MKTIDLNNATANEKADFLHNELHLNVIPADPARSKGTTIKWGHFQHERVSDEQHEQWKQEGDFNKGMAIITGKTWHTNLDYDVHLTSIDFDNELAIKEFCALFGPKATLEKLAKYLLIEQRPDDKTRAHVYFFTRKQTKKLNRVAVATTKDGKTVPIMEIKSDCTTIMNIASPHKNGSKYQFLGQGTHLYDGNIVTYDKLEKQIDSFLSKYGIAYLLESDSDNGNGKNFNFNFDGDEKISIGSRHNFLVSYADSLVRKLHKMTPPDAIKNAIEYVNQNYFEAPLPDAEVQRIFDDAIKFIGKQVEQEEKQKQEQGQGPERYAELWNNIYHQINDNPEKYIVADRRSNQLKEYEGKHVTIKANPDIIRHYLVDTNTYLGCIPDEIIKHRNPLTFLRTQELYTISFVDISGERFTLKQKTLANIASSLKDRACVFKDGHNNALNVIIQAYKKKQLVRINEDVPYIGFFTDKDNKILPTNIEIKEPIITELADAIKFIIDELKPHYENRIALLSTSIVWGMVAPIIFMLKTNNYFLKALHLFGFANATKSNTGKIILALDGHHEDRTYVTHYSRVDTQARFGDAVSKSTFPILIDEIKFDDKNSWFINQMKSTIESKTARTKFPNSKALEPEDIPALSTLILTSNSPPPFHDSGYMRRTIARPFPQSESWSENDPKAIEFKEFLRVNLPRLKALGEFRNWYIMNHQDEILDEKRPEPLDLGLIILKAVFAATEIEFPSWLEKRLPENELEESMQDSEVIVKSAFEKYINENLSRALTIWRLGLPKDQTLTLPDSISGRLGELAEDKIISDIKYSEKSEGFYIFSGILRELYKYGVARDQLPNLKDLGDYMGGEHTKYNGKTAVFVNKTQLKAYFDPIEKDDQQKID
jgi:hypothetical protein